MSHKLNWHFLACILVAFLYGVCSYDYCKMQDDCSKGKHIACHPEQMHEKGQEITKNYSRVSMSGKLRQKIVDAHNAKRNEISCGDGKVKDMNNETYPKAVRMRELIWDKELEYIAGMHAEQCIMAHDECRLSSKYRYAGQNLAMRTTTGPSGSISEAVNNFVNAWYDEYSVCTLPEVDEFGSTGTKEKIGHFTVMVNERVNRLGCAFTQCWLTPPGPGRHKYMYLFTCDYSYTNMNGIRIYKKGNKAASKCNEVDAAKSAKYKCLCANSDHVIEN